MNLSPLTCIFRLWYVITDSVNTVDFAAYIATDRKQTPGCGGASSTPVEIGYMNVIPKCNDWAGTFPVYESLPETYAAINTYLTNQPLEGGTRSWCSNKWDNFAKRCVDYKTVGASSWKWSRVKQQEARTIPVEHACKDCVGLLIVISEQKTIL